jgi:hypothetical protein
VWRIAGREGLEVTIWSGGPLPATTAALKRKSPAPQGAGLEAEEPLLPYGLVAVGNGQAACGFRVV